MLAVFAAAMLIGISSCSEEGNSLNKSSDAAYFNAPQFTLNTYEETSTQDLMGFDMDQEFQFFGNDQRRNPKDKFRPQKQFPLGRILAALDLTEEQRTAISEHLRAHHDCMREAMLALREAEFAIISAANEDRREIHEQFRNGEITREEARDDIRAIYTQLREDLDNNEEVLDARQAVRDCFETLFGNIEEELDEDQKELWESWLENYEELMQRRRR
jgi:hypothetical protein